MPGDEADIERLRTLGNYQFGRDAGGVLFPPDSGASIERSSSGRPRQVIAPDGRIASLTTLGRLTLGLVGGRRLHRSRPERYSVAVSPESDPYVRDGKNAFAKFVERVDPHVRPGDEVCVTSETGGLLGVGRAVLGATGMRDFETGVAVRIRDGATRRTAESGDSA